MILGTWLGAGWGARIRTWVWRNQNPLPYHLATPHHATAPRPAWPRRLGGRPERGGPYAVRPRLATALGWLDLGRGGIVFAARQRDEAPRRMDVRFGILGSEKVKLTR